MNYLHVKLKRFFALEQLAYVTNLLETNLDPSGNLWVLYL